MKAEDAILRRTCEPDVRAEASAIADHTPIRPPQARPINIAVVPNVSVRDHLRPWLLLGCRAAERGEGEGDGSRGDLHAAARWLGIAAIVGAEGGEQPLGLRFWL